MQMQVRHGILDVLGYINVEKNARVENIKNNLGDFVSGSGYFKNKKRGMV